MAAAASKRRMPATALTALFLLLSISDCCLGSRSVSRVSVSADGGYENVFVRIRDDVPEADCATILENLKVRKLDTRTRRRTRMPKALRVGKRTINRSIGRIMQARCMRAKWTRPNLFKMITQDCSQLESPKEILVRTISAIQLKGGRAGCRFYDI